MFFAGKGSVSVALEAAIEAAVMQELRKLSRRNLLVDFDDAAAALQIEL
ncbi:hypothetical protein [Mesorhizobium sp. L-2-11]|nr:hypothetical protein [Mesorhizobium sp. L-2-11]BCH19729.1 hypothetical protein MesoLjLa_65800 [Mesorhizobium sp. L-2-11]BCH19746.1 hypothetical protein MesoLjLa_65970 [Mesorhizobium sp. L-2-11]